MEVRKTQSGQILAHLQDGGAITSLTALQRFGIMRLGSRISDLHKLKHPIVDVWIKYTNRHGKSVSLKRYFMEKKMKYRGPGQCFECGKNVNSLKGYRDCTAIDVGRFLCLDCKEIINARNQEQRKRKKAADDAHLQNICDLFE